MNIPIIAFMVAAFAVPEVQVVATTTPVLLRAPQNLEAHVREYYKENPLLAEIARCESQFRQYDSKGEVLRGTVNSKDVGVMQINLFYHEADAAKLKHDLFTLEGNLKYAQALYDKKGSAPWVHSSPCWSKFKS